MVAPLIGAAVRMSAKKLAEKGGKKSVEELAKKRYNSRAAIEAAKKEAKQYDPYREIQEIVKSYNPRAAIEAAKKEAKQDDLYKKAAIGVGTAAVLPIAGKAGKDMGANAREAERIKEELEREAANELKREVARAESMKTINKATQTGKGINKNGEVSHGMKKGGSVCRGGSSKMAAGGQVCRGGGAATRGIKFQGVK